MCANAEELGSGLTPWPGESGARPGLKCPSWPHRASPSWWPPGSPDPPSPNSPERNPQLTWALRASPPPLQGHPSPQSPQWA